MIKGKGRVGAAAVRVPFGHRVDEFPPLYYDNGTLVMSQDAQKNELTPSSVRNDLVKTVQSPLGFFVLVVLIVESIFGVGLWRVSDENQATVIYFMTALIAVLVIIVAIAAAFRPEALYGRRPEPGVVVKALSFLDFGLTEGPGMDKFDIGEVVYVSPNAGEKEKEVVDSEEGLVAWNPSMKKYRGEPARIIKFTLDGPLAFYLDIDDGKYPWAPNWLLKIRKK